MSKSGLLIGCSLLLFLSGCNQNSGNTDNKDKNKKPATTSSKPATTSSTPAKATPATSTTAKEPALDKNKMSQKDKLSYAMGVQMGLGMRRSSVQSGMANDIDISMLVRGIKDAYSQKKLVMSPLELQIVIAKYRQRLIAERQAKLEKSPKFIALAKKHDEYFAKLKNDKNLTKHESGFYYKVIKAGTGKQAKATDTVVLHYNILTPQGKLLYSSKNTGKPATLVPGRAFIKVLKTAIPLMKVGGKWSIHTPQQLGFGKFGRPPVIGPMQPLVFNVELKEIKPAVSATPAAKPDTKKTDKKTENKPTGK